MLLKKQKKKNQFHLNLRDLRNHFKHTEPFLKENIAGFDLDYMFGDETVSDCYT